MGFVFSKLFSALFGDKELRILILGYFFFIEIAFPKDLIMLEKQRFYVFISYSLCI